MGSFWHLAAVLTSMGAAAGFAMAVVLWLMRHFHLHIPF